MYRDEHLEYQAPVVESAMHERLSETGEVDSEPERLEPPISQEGHEQFGQSHRSSFSVVHRMFVVRSACCYCAFPASSTALVQAPCGLKSAAKTSSHPPRSAIVNTWGGWVKAAAEAFTTVSFVGRKPNSTKAC